VAPPIYWAISTFPGETRAIGLSFEEERFDGMPAALSFVMSRRRRTTRGFTLVEMMIVVAIVSVLAMLAVVGYRKLIMSAHTTEATQMVQSIRTAQEAYHAETQTYVSTTNSLTATGGLYPPWNPANKTGWGAGISGVCSPPTASLNCWSALPIHVDSAVMFSYGTIGGVAGNITFPAVPTINGATIALPSAAPADWYFISAVGDTDNNGVSCTVIGTSFTNDLFVDKDGE
jgi:type IV pilus assembly protein PilA